MYNKNKLVDFLSSPNLSSVDVTVTFPMEKKMESKKETVKSEELFTWTLDFEE